MKSEKPGYFSFLLRIWEEKSEGKLIWRASLENPSDGKRLGFSDISTLHAYLLDLLEGHKSSQNTNDEQKMRGNQQVMGVNQN